MHKELINTEMEMIIKTDKEFVSTLAVYFTEIASRGEAHIREQIERLEKYLENCGLPNEVNDLPLKHQFSNGIYLREIFIPKGVLIVGKIHQHEHFNFMSYGDALVLTKDGVKRIVGPCTMLSSAGTKRALYTLEDTVWTTIHHNPTNETDIATIEEFTIAKDYSNFPLLEDVKQAMIGEAK